MIYELKNDKVSMSFSDFGGEITEMKVDGVSYIWNGDEKFWKFHAPILFPIVGRTYGGVIRVEGETYHLNSPHGFGRTSTFDMIEKTDSTITFNLKYSEETLKDYPFKFDLKVKYELVDTQVKIYYIVENVDDKKIYFSVGAHTALNCPFAPNDTFEDYYFEFAQKENASLIVCDESVLVTDEHQAYFDNENILNVNKKLFDNDALMFDDIASDVICLKSKNSAHYVEFDFTGFPYVALWSPKTEAPFVCIEPWYGLPDESGFEGDISTKKGIIPLEVGKIFECCHMITIH